MLQPSFIFGAHERDSNEIVRGFERFETRDPLSPLIFLLVVETLGAMLCKAKEGGLIEGFIVGREGTHVCHFQYADDTLILCQNSLVQIWMLRCVLRCFEEVLGLQMNFGKNVLVGVGDVPDIDSLATDLGCKVGNFPLQYLGLPLGASFKSNKA